MAPATSAPHDESDLCELAHRRLDELIRSARHQELRGVVGVELIVTDGVPHTVRRRMEATDKVA